MQISTKLFNQQQVGLFSKLNEEIQSLQNKISTGKNIIQASDDPVGAVELSALSQVSEKLNQYSKNAENAINRLNISDASLQGVVNLMVRASEISIQAANDTMGASDREAIALELDEMKEEMFNIGNTIDSSGAYIFSGYHTKTQPFQKDSLGRISYNGDRGINTIAVSENRMVGTTLDGGSVFMSILSNGSVSPMFTLLEDLTYAIRTQSESVSECKAVGSATLELENGNPGTWKFSLADNESSADIEVDIPGTDLTGVVTAINASGLNITATLSNNVITLKDSNNGPITLSNLDIEGLSTAQKNPKSWVTFDAIDGSGNSLAKTQRMYDYNQSIQSRLDDVKSVQEHVANQRAIIGARVNSLDRQKELIAQRKIAVQTDMANISEADLAALVTDLQSKITSLSASQQAFVKISGLNLFEYLR